MTTDFGSVCGLSLVSRASSFTLATPPRVGELAASSPIVAVVAPSVPNGPARYGMEKLREALVARGFRVAAFSPEVRADFFVVAGTTADCEAGQLLQAASAVLPTGPEALVIRRLHQYRGRPALALYGSDARGLMYAALDVAEHVARASNERDPFQNVREVEERPFLMERGVSMYTMHRGYFESRLFDERYWQKYFDLLAASRINNFVVIFGYENGGFMAPPYPYFFDLDGFPDVKFVGLTGAEQERNRAAFKRMMQLAHERGISVTAGIWDTSTGAACRPAEFPGRRRDPTSACPALSGESRLRISPRTPRPRSAVSFRCFPKWMRSSSVCTRSPG